MERLYIILAILPCRLPLWLIYFHTAAISNALTVSRQSQDPEDFEYGYCAER